MMDAQPIPRSRRRFKAFLFPFFAVVVAGVLVNRFFGSLPAPVQEFLWFLK